MSFWRRTFPEILDSLLTSITKGVAAEPHPFPPSGDSGLIYLHKTPVDEIVSVYGSVSGASYRFQDGIDYQLSSDGNAVEWLEGTDLPDEGTLLYVNYRPESARPELTDVHTGSVTRTLVETVALEIASMYANLEAVYNAGFIDHATGDALDNVVALLGIERVKDGRAVGEIEFTRAHGSDGVINIPAGTRVMTRDGATEYETIEPATMFPGQHIALAVARDLETNAPVKANRLTVMSMPIAGIEGVTNPAPTATSVHAETDAELRTRGKSLLHGSERGTLAAMRGAIIKQGIDADVIELPTPGHVEVKPHAVNPNPELVQRLLTAIEEARPAGVSVRLNLSTSSAHIADTEAMSEDTSPVDLHTSSDIVALNGVEALSEVGDD